MGSTGGVGARHKYYIHDEDGIGMGSLRESQRKEKYNVKVTSKQLSVLGTRSGKSAETVAGDNESTEIILPAMAVGIKRTVDVSVT
jgi:hypothetical protein